VSASGWKETQSDGGIGRSHTPVSSRIRSAAPGLSEGPRRASSLFRPGFAQLRDGGPGARRMLGNFPQAFSHVGLVNTAFNLSRGEGPTEQRSAP